MKTLAPSYLKHHLLIAMPQMDDPNFAQSVVYLVDHSDQGAMGLVINQPSGLNLADVLEQLRPDGIPAEHCKRLQIMTGGPVQTDRGFVLHPAGYNFQATLDLGELGLSTSQDALFAIADHKGPAKHLIALGYAGWGAGQLESELADNAWLSCPADPAILFDLPPEQRLQAAARRLGVNLGLLTRQAGHA
ncbi:YqgE/AlgH family protein [Pseudomonas sp. N040]|uniref:YqgE/AlgH family protein n=1 Tax=Pseudomonas sp. N040 TaxID=2785325 RepID=UPI0018A2C217|nr:YqgE/AlgH family protein [Pseudomonas sp. N040]MBF7729995.1 YqgE/AlgH family protein [Pseudomonas sp. N040]MBW7013637.1 YqgE/AlgH family protein [Pseudomonas sp. N040]